MNKNIAALILMFCIIGIVALFDYVISLIPLETLHDINNLIFASIVLFLMFIICRIIIEPIENKERNNEHK